MNYSGSSIECVRFGARKGRESIGCCGLDLLQAFNNSPLGTAVYPLRWGDEDTFIYKDGEIQCLSGTNEELFWAMLQTGSHDNGPKASRAFLAVLTSEQVEDGPHWLDLLAEAGFEFIKAFSNGVYGGEHGPLYLFGYFRFSSGYEEEHDLGPPPRWESLKKGVPCFEPQRFYDRLTTVPEERLDV